MKRKDKKNEEPKRKSMKQLSKDHEKAVKGKKENPKHKEYFEDTLKEFLSSSENN